MTIGNMRGRRVFYAICLVLAARSSAQLSTPAEAYLDQIAETWQSYPTIVLGVESTTRESNEGFPDPVVKTDSMTLHPIPSFRLTHSAQSIVQDSGRYALRGQLYWSNSENETPSLIQKTSHVWDGERFYEHSTPAGVDDSPLFVRRDESVGKGMYRKHLNGSELLGYIGDDNAPFYEVMRDATRLTLSDETTEVAGHPCDLLVAETDQGRYELWIQQDNALALRRVRVTRDSTHRVSGEGPPAKVEEDLDGNIIITSSKTKQEELILDDIRMTEIDGLLQIVSYRKTRIRDFEGGGHQVQASEVVAKESSRNPAAVSYDAFQMNEIADGTEVRYVDGPERDIAFVWDAGEIRQRIAEEVMDTISDQTPTEESVEEREIDSSIETNEAEPTKSTSIQAPLEPSPRDNRWIAALVLLVALVSAGYVYSRALRR